ncbi:MAG: hypothetical protein WEA10_04840 [Actinomycetota bacterium]
MAVREQALAILRGAGHILPQRELTRVVNEVSDQVVGFGPIESLLRDPDVTEVAVNGPDGLGFIPRQRSDQAHHGGCLRPQPGGSVHL